MRFWDSSAIVPLFISEPSSRRLRALLASDPDVALWTLTEAEVVSALGRRQRAGDLGDAAAIAAERELDRALDVWVVVGDVTGVLRTARKLLKLYRLRTADALQLAAATLLSENRPEILPLVTLDDRLAEAARREGFPVLP